MFPVGKANFFARKNILWGYHGHKIAEEILSDLGRGGFGFAGGGRLWSYDADN